ncbi:MAG: 1,4-alpha-glucan branching enzyme, partial [Winogradskyella sp.]|nr:1,4-alpha-glucan branching enzyme [Winogradskyella sp.]
KDAYKVGLPRKGKIKEIFNSDLKKYFGSGLYKNTIRTTEDKPWHFRDFSVDVKLPPLGMVVFKYSK